MAQIRLKIYRSPSEARAETYRQPRVTIGREINNDIVVPEKEVSRFHCLFEYDKDGWRVVDLESTNGTYLNGIAIRKSPIKNGDVVVVGSIRLHVLECTAIAPPAPMPVGAYRVLQTFDARAIVEAKGPTPGRVRPAAAKAGVGGETTPAPSFPATLAPALTAGEILQGARDPHALAQTLARRVAALVKADVCEVLLYDPETNELACTTVEPASDAFAVPAEVLEHVREKKSAVYVELNEACEVAGASPQPKAVMCAPMLDGERLLGAIALLRNKSLWDFGDPDFETLAVSALSAAAVLSCAQSYARLETAYLDLLEASDALPATIGDRQQEEADMVLLEATAQKLRSVVTRVLEKSRVLAKQGEQNEAARGLLGEMDEAAKQSYEIAGRVARLARQVYDAPGETSPSELLRDIQPALQDIAGRMVPFTARIADDLWRVAVAPRVVRSALARIVLFCRDKLSAMRLTFAGENCSLDRALHVEGYTEIGAGRYVRVSVAAESEGAAVEELRALRDDEAETLLDPRSRVVGLYWAARMLRRAAARLIVRSEGEHTITFELYLPLSV